MAKRNKYEINVLKELIAESPEDSREFIAKAKNRYPSL